MIFRAIALSLALLIGIGAVVPLATNYTEAGARKHRKHKKKHKKYKKYSKQWWRAYHARARQRKALQARRRMMRLRQIRLANARKAVQNNGTGQNVAAKSNNRKAAVENSAAMLPSGETAPKGWKRGATSPSELQYRVDDDKGANLGLASVTIVGPTQGADSDDVRNKTVGGVATSSLRGTVIDKMIRESGWVVNDYQKQVGGKKVYVVVAQSPGAGGAIQSRLFYFTEVGGSIYSVATNAPVDNSRRIEEETEKVINSLQHRTNPVQQAELK